jgi:hypothetical protein
MTIPVDEHPRPHKPLRLLATLCVAALVAIGLGAVAVEHDTTPASAATVSFSQCNGHESGPPGGAALSVTCSVSIVNTIDATGGTSAVVYLRTCTLNGCTGDISSSSDVINAVHQCNDSDNAGGSATICTVDIVNNISANAPAPATALTVNQCNGSGQGGGANVEACISSAQGSPSVSQCNGSGNGGGGTLVCTASGTTSASFPVTVDQCNGSENGGGSTVTCSTTITTNVTDTHTGPSIPTTPPTDTPTTPGSGSPTTPGSGTPGGTPQNSGGGSGSTNGGPSSGTPTIDRFEASPPATPVEAPPNLTG